MAAIVCGFHWISQELMVGVDYITMNVHAYVQAAYVNEIYHKGIAANNDEMFNVKINFTLIQTSSWLNDLCKWLKEHGWRPGSYSEMPLAREGGLAFKRFYISFYTYSSSIVCYVITDIHWKDMANLMKFTQLQCTI